MYKLFQIPLNPLDSIDIISYHAWYLNGEIVKLTPGNIFFDSFRLVDAPPDPQRKNI